VEKPPKTTEPKPQKLNAEQQQFEVVRKRDAPPQTITTDNHPSKEAKEEPRKIECMSHTNFKKKFFVQCNASEEA